MQPYKFEVYLKKTLWGSEIWQVSGVPGHESVVTSGGTGGEDVGLSLPALIARHGADLLGERVYRAFGNEFPLLVKFIDARQDLSIQVHPNDELARRRHGCNGKTEMWYVIKSDPGAKIHAGLRRRLTPEEFVGLTAQESEGNAFADVIATYDSRPGEAFFLPAGRIHAIGAGNLLAEIQQTSDVTYRIYDYGRKDANGNTRELHTDLAKDAIDYDDVDAANCRVTYDAYAANAELVNCPYFNVRRVAVEKSERIDLQTDSFVILVCLSGAADVNGASVRQGETLLVPAKENVLEVVGTATFLTATV